VDQSHIIIHLLQQVLFVEEILQGQLSTKLIISNGELKFQSNIRQTFSEHFIQPGKSVSEVCETEEKL